MKLGTKLQRINRSSISCKVHIGKVYTYDGESNGFIRLKERKRDGYSWELKNFIVLD